MVRPSPTSSLTTTQGSRQAQSYDLSGVSRPQAAQLRVRPSAMSTALTRRSLWYLMLALFLIAIIEKDNIQDPATDSYFNRPRASRWLR